MEQKFITLSFTVEQAKRITNGEIDGRIVTRNGSSVRIICWDCKGEYNIVALVSNNKKGTETARYYDADGCEFKYTAGAYDLLLQFPEYVTFKDGDVLYARTSKFWYIFIYRDKNKEKTWCYATIDENNTLFIGDNRIVSDEGILELRFATESEKQNLIEALQESTDPRAVDYLKKLGVEAKTKCKFTAGQPVIGMDGRGEWRYDLFSHYKPNKQNGEYVCTGRSYKHCLPYEGNEHLLGTNKSAEE